MPGRVEACLEAAALARRLGRADLLAEAAVTLESGDADLSYELRARELCEEALAALDPAPTPLRARVAANLADACMYLVDPEAAALASAEALAVAERCADPVALVAALRARQLVCSGPDGVAERARLAEEMLALARTTGAAGTRMWAHLWRIDVAFQRGDLAAVASELEPLAACAEQVRGPVARWHLLQARAVLAQAQARFADARRLADQALAALPPTATGHQSAVINRTAVLSTVALHTGEDLDLGGLRAGDDPADDGFATVGVIFAVAAAYFLAAQGRLAEARDHLPQPRPARAMAALPAHDHGLSGVRHRHRDRARPTRRRRRTAPTARPVPWPARGERRRLRGLQRARRALPRAWPRATSAGSTRPSPTSRRPPGRARPTGRPGSTSRPAASSPRCSPRGPARATRRAPGRSPPTSRRRPKRSA